MAVQNPPPFLVEKLPNLLCYRLFLPLVPVRRPQQTPVSQPTTLPTPPSRADTRVPTLTVERHKDRIGCWVHIFRAQPIADASLPTNRDAPNLSERHKYELVHYLSVDLDTSVDVDRATLSMHGGDHLSARLPFSNASSALSARLDRDVLRPSPFELVAAGWKHARVHCRSCDSVLCDAGKLNTASRASAIPWTELLGNVTCVAPEEYLGMHGDPAFNVVGRSPDSDRVLIGDACVSIHKHAVRRGAVNVRATQLCSSTEQLHSTRTHTHTNTNQCCDDQDNTNNNSTHNNNNNNNKEDDGVADIERAVDELYLSEDLGASGPNLALRLAAHCNTCGTWIGDAEVISQPHKSSEKGKHNPNANPNQNKSDGTNTLTEEEEKLPWALLRIFKCRVSVDVCASEEEVTGNNNTPVSANVSDAAESSTSRETGAPLHSSRTTGSTTKSPGNDANKPLLPRSVYRSTIELNTVLQTYSSLSLLGSFVLEASRNRDRKKFLLYGFPSTTATSTTIQARQPIPRARLVFLSNDSWVSTPGQEFHPVIKFLYLPIDTESDINETETNESNSNETYPTKVDVNLNVNAGELKKEGEESVRQAMRWARECGAETVVLEDMDCDAVMNCLETYNQALPPSAQWLGIMRVGYLDW